MHNQTLGEKILKWNQNKIKQSIVFNTSSTNMMHYLRHAKVGLLNSQDV